MPVYSADAPPPVTLARRFWSVVAGILLLTALSVPVGVTAWCAFAPEPVVMGPYFIVGPRCDPGPSLVILSGMYKSTYEPEPEYWRKNGEALLGRRRLQIGPFTVFQLSGRIPWPLR